MATSITFTDGTGAAELTNGMPAPGDRFTGWTLLTNVSDNGAGVVKHALGTGLPAAYSFRTDYGAKFSLRYIPNADQATLTRLKRHLESGGSITVTTGDTEGNSYTAYLWPGARVEISAPDRQDLRLTVTLSVLNADAADMLCLYN